MHDDHHQGAKVSDESLHEGYEVHDMKPGLMLASMIGLIVTTLFGLGTISIYMTHLDKASPPVAQQRSPLSRGLAFAPGAPPLQTDSVADRKALFAHEEALLSGENAYGWVSKEPGMERVHIPIRRAMELIAEGKVPYRQKPQDAALPATAKQGDVAPAAQK